jgi:hypothetical protein
VRPLSFLRAVSKYQLEITMSKFIGRVTRLTKNAGVEGATTDSKFCYPVSGDAIPCTTTVVRTCAQVTFSGNTCQD